MDNYSFTPYAVPRPVHTVLGNIPYTDLGITDGHNHVWIDPIPGAYPASPVLNEFNQIVEELVRYRLAGGNTILDCQPGGCGRNGNQLVQLAKKSAVNIIACTGFHRVRYYAPNYWLFNADEQQAALYFTKELTKSLSETESKAAPVLAGFIKVALEADWESTPQSALKGAALAARNTGAMIEIHTEKGALAEKIVPFFEKNGVPPDRLVICHIDKRMDIQLHIALARTGVLLEYDSFYRPKYQPEHNVWPMICQMVEAGFENSLVLATDMADSTMYKTIGGGPGLESLPSDINIRLTKLGFSANAIKQMLGGNIARRLAGLI